MTETPEQRARRLGLVKETPEERAQRLGLSGAPKIELDIRVPSESSHALPHNREDRDTNFAGISEGAGPAALGILASGAQAIPGMEAVQAGVRSVVRGQPFREARDDMRAVTDDIPAPIKLAAQIPAMAAGGAALKLSPAKAGSLFAATDQGLSADDMSLEARLARAGAGAVGGAVAGKTLDALITGGRALTATGTGANATRRQAAMSAADKTNYGAAAAEGAASTNLTPISTVLASPDIKPFTDIVRSSRKFAMADEPTVLMETFKQMSKQQGGLARQLKRDGYDAAKQLQHDNIKLAKDELLNAADAAGMPGLRKAVEAHAKAAGEIDAVEVGAKAAQRVVGAPATSRLRTQSQEAMENTIRRMPEGQREAAIEGTLGGLKERIRPNANPISGFGAFAALHRPSRVAAFLRNVGDKKQMTLDQLVRSGALGATTLEELLDR